jgi:hypothetical protein
MTHAGGRCWRSYKQQTRMVCCLQRIRRHSLAGTSILSPFCGALALQSHATSSMVLLPASRWPASAGTHTHTHTHTHSVRIKTTRTRGLHESYTALGGQSDCTRQIQAMAYARRNACLSQQAIPCSCHRRSRTYPYSCKHHSMSSKYAVLVGTTICPTTVAAPAHCPSVA